MLSYKGSCSTISSRPSSEISQFLANTFNMAKALFLFALLVFFATITASILPEEDDAHAVALQLDETMRAGLCPCKCKSKKARRKTKKKCKKLKPFCKLMKCRTKKGKKGFECCNPGTPEPKP